MAVSADTTIEPSATVAATAAGSGYTVGEGTNETAPHRSTSNRRLDGSADVVAAAASAGTSSMGREITSTRMSSLAVGSRSTASRANFERRELHHQDTIFSDETWEGPRVETSHFRWVQTNAFEGFFGVMIMINSAIVVVETDYRQKDNEWVGWVILDSIFTLVFLVEAVLRMFGFKHLWWRSAWNVFDLLLVIVGIADCWVLPLLKSETEVGALEMLRIARLVRMLRILRLLRLLRYSQKLVLLVHALWGALRALFWFMIMVVAVLYVFALVLTRVTRMDPGLQDRDLIVEWFGSMPRSLFTLFQMMTLEAWPDIARETLDDTPWLTVFYISFILLTNVTLLNIVAGVLTENVLSTARKDKLRQQEKRDKALEQEREMLGEELAELDQNGDGMLDLKELQALDADPEQAPHMTRFLKLAGLTPAEAEELFFLADYDDTGVVSYKDFVDATRRARGPIQSKHVINLRRDVAKLSLEIDYVATLLQRVSDRVTELASRREGRGSSPCIPAAHVFAGALVPPEAPTSSRPTRVASSESLVPRATSSGSLGPCMQATSSRRLAAQASNVGGQAPQPVPRVTLSELRHDFMAQLSAMEATLWHLHAAEAAACC